MDAKVLLSELINRLNTIEEKIDYLMQPVQEQSVTEVPAEQDNMIDLDKDFTDDEVIGMFANGRDVRDFEVIKPKKQAPPPQTQAKSNIRLHKDSSVKYKNQD